MRALIVSTALLLVGTTAAAGEQQLVPFASDRVVTVMARNVYHGVDAEIFAIPAATSVADLLDKVAAVYQGYLARNFPERAAAFAAEIDAARPELIALQEAVLVRTQSPPDGPATPATTVALDYVQLLLEALAARGLAYEVVAQSIGFDVELPRTRLRCPPYRSRGDPRACGSGNRGPQALQCPSRHLRRQLPDPQRQPRANHDPPGWVSIDAKIRGKQFRFVSTHLDGDYLPFTSAVQQAQAVDLLAHPAATPLPLVLVGDLNSPPDGTGVAYNVLIAAGFSDSWALAGTGSGLTCCQADDLLNSVSSLDRRIDFVLFRGAFTALAADVARATRTHRSLARRRRAKAVGRRHRAPLRRNATS